MRERRRVPGLTSSLRGHARYLFRECGSVGGNLLAATAICRGDRLDPATRRPAPFKSASGPRRGTILFWMYAAPESESAMPATRRRFLTTLAGTAALGLTDVATLERLRVFADEKSPVPETVRF